MQLEQRHYDVAIVGGGMAGASAALALQQLGLNIVLIEQFPQRNKSTSTPEQVVALSWGTVQYLKSLNAWDNIAALGVAKLRDVHVSQAGKPAYVKLLHQEEQVDALGFVVQNRHIIQALYQHIEHEIDIICPAQVISLSDTVNGKKVTLSTPEETFDIQASLVIAADGTYSRIRHMAGILTRGWDHNRFALVASVMPEKPHKNIAYECFRPDGPLAFLPLDDKRFSIVWTLKPSDATRMLQASSLLFLNRLNMAMGEPLQHQLGRITESSRATSFPLELRISQQYTQTHLALIGNAARTLHPVAGQGMNLSIRDVADLCACIQAGLQQQHPLGSQHMLDAYAALRQKDQQRTVCLTEGLNLAFNHEHTLLEHLNQGGLNLLSHVSFLRHRLTQQAAGLV